MSSELTNLYSQISKLRNEVREFFGGVTFKPISKDFGIYKMNLPENADVCRFAEHHFVELEKLFQALESSEYPHE